MDVRFIVVIISQNIQILNHYGGHLKLICQLHLNKKKIWMGCGVGVEIRSVIYGLIVRIKAILRCTTSREAPRVVRLCPSEFGSHKVSLYFSISCWSHLFFFTNEHSEFLTRYKIFRSM